MKILSSFILSRVIPNLYEFLSSAEHKRGWFEEYQQTVDVAPLNSIVFILFPFHSMKVNSQLFGY